MTQLRNGFFQRLAALLRKEFNQIRRDRRLAMSLVVPPTLQLLLFGFALNATVSNLRLGLVDESRTPESRELAANMTETKSFRLTSTYFSVDDLGRAISAGNLDAGLVIPYGYAKDLTRHRQATVQVFLNGVNANNAAVGQQYAEGIIASYNQKLKGKGPLHAQLSQVALSSTPSRGNITLVPAFLFNPGLVSSWFIVTGTFGVLLILNGSLVASTAMIKEREAGTVEQLLMTPAGTAEIIIAKIAPIFLLQLNVVILAILLLKFVFDVPLRGNLLFVLAGGALCVLCGIGIGTLVATVSKTAGQSQLMSFFVNPPLASLSGALTPIEAMPHWLQPLTQANPINHFSVISRGVFLRGSGFQTLWPNFLALTLIMLTLLTLSVWRFRKQLG